MESPTFASLENHGARSQTLASRSQRHREGRRENVSDRLLPFLISAPLFPRQTPRSSRSKLRSSQPGHCSPVLVPFVHILLHLSLGWLYPIPTESGLLALRTGDRCRHKPRTSRRAAPKGRPPPSRSLRSSHPHLVLPHLHCPSAGASSLVLHSSSLRAAPMLAVVLTVSPAVARGGA